MTEELEVIAISPDTIFVNGTAITEMDAYAAVDNVLTDLEKTLDFQNVDTTIDTLLGLQRLSGKSLAKLLSGASKWWSTSSTTAGKSFEDHMESRHGLKGVTINRYITVWDCIEMGEIPSDVAVRPMRELIPIAKTLAHGHKIEKKQWEKIVKATGLGEISDILRNIKNKPPRKSSTQIYMSRDGSLNAWKNNKKTFLGWLDMEAYQKNEDAKKAIDRILDSSGVIRK